MNGFSFFATGWCACSSLMNFANGDIGWGIGLAALAVLNIIIGVS